MKRYHVKCRWCDGTGFHRETDTETGNAVITKCVCYRGGITFKLTPEDERELLLELKRSLGES